MRAAEVELLIGRLRGINRTLSGVYPYAFRVGAGLRRLEAAGLHRAFTEAEPRAASYPLQQARDYAFLQWLEAADSGADLARVDQLAAEIISSAEPALAVELTNTVEWYERER